MIDPNRTGNSDELQKLYVGIPFIIIIIFFLSVAVCIAPKPQVYLTATAAVSTWQIPEKVDLFCVAEMQGLLTYT